jgi:protein SCO1/2
MSAPAMASFYGKKTGPLPAVGAGSDEGPVAPADIEVVENLGEKLPRGLTFRDGHGRPVALDQMLAQGKPLLLTLGYFRCPMLCDLVHSGLVKAVKAAGVTLGKDFTGLSISIDPQENTKSVNTKQGRLMRALGHTKREDWPFVYAPGGADVDNLARVLGFRYKYDPKSKQFAHAAVAFVISPGGTISRYLYGVDFPARDVRFALVEAGEGRVGTSLDRVLLACFRYDPMARRYTPYGAAFIRIGAGASGLALLILLAVLWRKEWVIHRRRRLA